MKKNFIFWIWVICMFSLSGCVGNLANQNSSPGNVLGMKSQADQNRIVTFNVVGKGVEPELSLTKGQAVLMAERAAVADGYRQFVEKIRGVYVEAYMKAGYGAVNMEVVKTSTQSWLRGVEVIEIRQGALGIVEAHMQLRVNFAKNNMVWWPVGLGSSVSGS